MVREDKGKASHVALSLAAIGGRLVLFNKAIFNNVKKETMQKQKRVKYEAPSIELVEVELEQGIAAGSSDIHPGDQSTPNTPKVEDWNDTGFQSQDFDV